jgi:hypothetical protein
MNTTAAKLVLYLLHYAFSKITVHFLVDLLNFRQKVQKQAINETDSGFEIRFEIQMLKIWINLAPSCSGFEVGSKDKITMLL